MALYGQSKTPPPSPVAKPVRQGSQPPGYNAALQYYQGQYEPQQAALDLQQSQQQQRLGLLEAGRGMGASNAGQNAAFANQGYDLGMEKLGLQRNSLGSNTDYYNQLLGLLGNDLSGTLGYQDKLQTLASQLYGVNQAEVGTAADIQRRNQISSAVGSGALQSKGNIQSLADIYTNRDYGLSKLKTGFETANAGFDEARRSAQTGFEQRQLGIKHELDLNADQLKMLDLTAKDLGLSRDKALSAIKQGLDSLNLSSVLDVQDVFDALSSGDFQRQQIGEQIVRSATSAYGAGYFGNGSAYGASGNPSRPTTSKSKSKRSSSTPPDLTLGGFDKLPR